MNTKIEKKVHTKPTTIKKEEKADTRTFALGIRNLWLIGIAFVIIIVGFALMTGAGSTPEQYNPDIFSFRRIILGPGIAFMGFIFMVAAILYKDKKTIKSDNE